MNGHRPFASTHFYSRANYLFILQLGRFFVTLLTIERAINSELLRDDIGDETMEVFIYRKLFFESSRNIIRFIVRSICGVGTKLVSLQAFQHICCGSDGLSNLLNKYYIRSTIQNE